MLSYCFNSSSWLKFININNIIVIIICLWIQEAYKICFSHAPSVDVPGYINLITFSICFFKNSLWGFIESRDKMHVVFL